MVHGGTKLLLVASAVLACASCVCGAEEAQKTRRHYIAANQVVWNYTPSGQNQCQGRDFTPQEALFLRGGNSSTYLKAQFQAYSDATFDTKLDRPAEEAHLAMMGPLLRAAVGDIIEVHLRNNLDFPINMVPQGVTYSAFQAVKVAAPGETIVYAWGVPELAGPAPESDSSSAMWLYRSIVDQQAHADAGLAGALIITRAADADPATAKPTDVDAEFVTVFQVVDEASSPFAKANAKRFGGADGRNGIDTRDFARSQLKHTINGRLFCNLEGLRASVDQRVRWHTSVNGDKVSVHNAHWHGLVFERDGRNTDQFQVLPSRTWTAKLVTDNPGTWMLHCHVNAHYPAGMQALFTLEGEQQTPFDFSGTERTFYIQSEEQVWNYARSGGDLCSGTKTAFGPAALASLGNSDDRIGPASIKARFIEYTDATFSTVRERTEAEEHLGWLGPAIRAEVGDKVNIVFRNQCRFPTTLHVHGLRFNKTSEGSGYSDGTTGDSKTDDGIPTGGSYTYTFEIPERGGPGPSEASSKLWMYHSYADETADTSAGLMGPLIISRRGASRANGTPADVDREFVMFFSVTDESASSLFVANLNRNLGEQYVGDNGVPEVRLGTPALAANSNKQRAFQSVKAAATAAELPALADLLGDAKFGESNLKSSINGYMYCNMPSLEAKVGQRVRFYTMALGSEVDLHTPNLDSASMDWQGRNQNAMMLLPGGMETADVTLAAEGRWMFQCRVEEHLTSGMRAMFLARPADDPSLTPSLVTSPGGDAASLADAGPRATLQASQRVSSSSDSSPSSMLFGSFGTTSAATRSSDRTSGGNDKPYSRLAAGLSLSPLKDVAYAASKTLRSSLFASTKSLPSLASVAARTGRGKAIRTPVARTYYIQAQEQVWNYAPRGLNRCTGERFAERSALYATRTSNTLGPRAIKALYRGYTDATFKTPLPHDAKLGILGPLIQAQVGDTIRIVFRNDLDSAARLVMGGALVSADADATVAPGVTRTYLWQVPEEAGPQGDDPSSVHYPYYSTVTDQYSGLIGVVMVARQGTLTAQGTIPGIDLVQPLLFQVWDEGASAYLTQNIAKYNPLVDTGSPDYKEGNRKHAINGYLYCNMPDIYVKQRKTVRFMQLAQGTETDMHAPVFNDQVLVVDHIHTAATMLFPGVTRTADMMAASAPGIFQYRCDFGDQSAAGMQARLVVTS